MSEPGATAPAPAALNVLRAYVWRVSLVLGMALTSVMAGRLLLAAMVRGVHDLLAGIQARPLQLALLLWVDHLWLWLFAPLVCYAVARVTELRPWFTSLGVPLVGQLLLLSIQYILGAAAAPVWAEALLLGLGVGLCRYALKLAQLHAARSQARAEMQASAAKEEYAEFLREAERLASRHDSPASNEDSSSKPPSQA